MGGGGAAALEFDYWIARVKRLSVLLREIEEEDEEIEMA